MFFVFLLCFLDFKVHKRHMPVFLSFLNSAASLPASPFCAPLVLTFALGTPSCDFFWTSTAARGISIFFPPWTGRRGIFMKNLRGGGLFCVEESNRNCQHGHV